MTEPRALTRAGYLKLPHYTNEEHYNKALKNIQKHFVYDKITYNNTSADIILFFKNVFDNNTSIGKLCFQ